MNTHESKENFEISPKQDELVCCLYCGRDTSNECKICDVCLGDKPSPSEQERLRCNTWPFPCSEKELRELGMNPNEF